MPKSPGRIYWYFVNICGHFTGIWNGFSVFYSKDGKGWRWLMRMYWLVGHLSGMFPRGVVDAPYLEVFTEFWVTSKPKVTFNGMCPWHPWQRAWTRWSLEVPSNPNHSVIHSVVFVQFTKTHNKTQQLSIQVHLSGLKSQWSTTKERRHCCFAV